MKKLLLFLCLVFSAQITNAQIDANLANQLQTVLNNSVSNQGNNGVSAHVILPNGQTWTGTAGVGKQNLPVTDTTLFHGASTTKFNIALLMMLLAEDNLVDLDASWTAYVSLNVGFDTNITVRQLLNHTSGIADYLETSSSGADVTADFTRFYTPQYILENIVSDTPLFTVGTGFQYSNSNYVLAALIIEAITGNPVQTELRNRIWTPLGMNHTYFGAYDNYTEPTAGVWWNFGSGVTNYSNMPTTSMLSYAYAAGNIVTCPTDLGILLHSVLNGQLVSTGSLDEMKTFIPNSFSSWTAGYGLGIHHANGQTDDVVLGHDGYFSNLTDMFHSTNHGFTLVTMTNTQTQWFGLFNPMYDILANYSMTSDVSNIQNKFELTIAPNPTNNQINISSKKTIEELTIVDMLGKVVYQEKPQSQNISLRLNVDGLYFVRLKSGDRMEVRKVIVQ